MTPSRELVEAAYALHAALCRSYVRGQLEEEETVAFERMERAICAAGPLAKEEA